MHKTKRRKSKGIWIAAAVLLVLAAAAAVAILFLGRNTCTVSFLMPDGSAVKERVRQGEVLDRLPEPPVREGYAFLGWEDETGAPYSGGAVREDVQYSPRFMPALNAGAGEHAPYLFADDRGFLRPGDPFTRREAALLLRPCLPGDTVPEEGFTDLAGDDACAEAAGVLRALGLVSGESFRPDEALTLRQAVTLTAPFFSPEETEGAGPAWLQEADPDRALFLTAYSLGWLEGWEDAGRDPDGPLNRGEAAAFFNRVLNRSVQPVELAEHAGAYPDVSPLHPYYLDLMEAAIPHSLRMAGGREIWTDSEATGRLPEGLTSLGGRLYYIDRNGYLLTGEKVGGLSFDETGAYTSGDVELDTLVREILSQVVTGTMEPLEKLRAAYNYCRDKLTYIPSDILALGETGWETEKAKTTLSTGKGNCYGFAAAFWALAREIGYDAQVWSGVIAYDRSPHGFVTIEIEGKNYLFDPEIEASRMLQNIEEDRFMLDPDSSLAEDWAYRPITKTLK